MDHENVMQEIQREDGHLQTKERDLQQIFTSQFSGGTNSSDCLILGSKLQWISVVWECVGICYHSLSKLIYPESTLYACLLGVTSFSPSIYEIQMRLILSQPYPWVHEPRLAYYGSPNLWPVLLIQKWTYNTNET